MARQRLRCRLWVLQLGRLADPVRAVAVLGDGRVVTGGADGRVLLWDPARPGAPVELGRHGLSVTAVAVLPDGRVVTGGADRRVLLGTRPERARRSFS